MTADYKRMMLHKPEFIICDSDFFENLYTRSDECRTASGNTAKQNSKTVCLKRALKRMKKRHRLILRYRADEISYRKISGLMNISEKAAMEVHRRAVKRMKKLFWEGDGGKITPCPFSYY